MQVRVVPGPARINRPRRQKRTQSHARTPSRGIVLLEPVDLLLMIALATSLGLLMATHVALSFGLGKKGPWHRGLVAFLVPPLAPFWGYHGKLHKRSLVWIVALSVHLLCLIAANIGRIRS